MSATIARVRKWMYATLAADPTVASVVGSRVYAEEAPQGASFPLVLFAHIGNTDNVRAMGNSRMNKAIWLVRAVEKDSSPMGGAMTVADRFDPLLLVQNVVIDGVVRINYVQHDQDSMRSDATDGVPYSYLGSYYLVFSQPTT